MNNEDYLIISIPGDPKQEAEYYELTRILSSTNCGLYKFYVPVLKSTSLDKLLLASDELTKLEIQAEQLTRRLAQSLIDLTKDNNENCFLADNDSLDGYIKTFKWDVAKYPTGQGIENILKLLGKQMTTTDLQLEQKISAYNYARNEYEALEKKRVGSLMTRSLVNEVKKEDFVLNSKFLVTLMVVVPKRLRECWFRKYENLHPEVVPRTTKMITEDGELELYSVTLFKRACPKFKENARQNGFTVRDFDFDEYAIDNIKAKQKENLEKKLALYNPLIRWCRTNFSEIFITLTHVKATKIFVESVLRYGLPPCFRAVLIVTDRKTTSKIKNILDCHYGKLGVCDFAGDQENESTFLDKEHHPYVFTSLKTDIKEILINQK